MIKLFSQTDTSFSSNGDKGDTGASEWGNLTGTLSNQTDLQSALDTKVNTSNLLNLIYPIGSIYLSVNSTSPATLFGGTWEQIKDRFLLSAGDTYTAGSTGGEATHTLTIDEMPSHNHTQAIDSSYNPASAGESGHYAQNDRNSNASPTGLSTSYSGGGQAHNNMPPYLVVYVWKRTA